MSPPPIAVHKSNWHRVVHCTWLEGNAALINTTVSANESCESVTNCPAQGGGGVNTNTPGLTLSNSIFWEMASLTAVEIAGAAFFRPSPTGTPNDGTTAVGDNVVGRHPPDRPGGKWRPDRQRSSPRSAGEQWRTGPDHGCFGRKSSTRCRRRTDLSRRCCV